MDYHIISVGDGAFLTQIFRFLSFLNSPGNNYFTHLGMVGGMLGLIMIIYTAIDNGQMPFGKMLLSVAAFTVFFGTPVRVTIEDYYTGTTRVVNNVPFGSGAIGYIVSTLGIGIKDAFQQATSVPGAGGDYGNLPPQYAMNAFLSLRQLSGGDLCATGNTLCGLNMSTKAYISDCYLPVLRARESTPFGDVRSAADALAAMKNGSTARATTFYPADRTKPAVPMTCAGAYEQLVSGYADPKAQTAMCSALVSAGVTRLAADGADKTGSLSCDGQSGNPLEFAKEAIGRSGLNAQAMMQNAMVSNIYNQALAHNGYGNTAQTDTAIVNTGAIAQHNVQSASEGFIWLRGIRSIMTFFEGFAYGIVPFLALLLPIPGIGTKMFGRMVAILLWISLWTPLASFVNLYQIMAVTGRLDALHGARPDVPIESMFGINEVQMAAADWVATTSAMMPMVVTLTGFLLFGGIAAFSSVARGVGGGDFVDEKLLAPNVGSVGEVMKTVPGGQASQISGATMTDMPLLNYTLNSGSSQAISEKQSAIETRLAQRAVSLSNTASDTKNVTSSGSHTETSGNSVGATFGAQEGAQKRDDLSHGSTSAASSGVKDSITDADQGKLGLAVPGVAGATGSHGMSHANDVGVSGTDSAGTQAGAGTTRAAVAGLVHSALAGHGDANSIIKAAGMGSSEAEEFRKAYSEAQSEMSALERVASVNHSMGESVARTDVQIGAAVDRNGLAETVQAEAQAIGGSRYHETLDNLRSAPGYSEKTPEQLQTIAAVRTLHDAAQPTSGYTAEQRVEAQVAFATAFASASGLGSADTRAAFGSVDTGVVDRVRSGVGDVRDGLSDLAGTDAMNRPANAPNQLLFADGQERNGNVVAEKQVIERFDSVYRPEAERLGEVWSTQERTRAADQMLGSIAATTPPELPLTTVGTGGLARIVADPKGWYQNMTSDKQALANEYEKARGVYRDPDMALYAARTATGLNDADLGSKLTERYGENAVSAVSAMARTNSMDHDPKRVFHAASFVNELFTLKGSPAAEVLSPEMDIALRQAARK